MHVILSESSYKSICSISWYRELTSVIELDKCKFFKIIILWILYFITYKISIFLYNRFQLLNPKKVKLWPWGGPTGWTFWLVQREVIGWSEYFLLQWTTNWLIFTPNKQLLIISCWTLWVFSIKSMAFVTHLE